MLLIFGWAVCSITVMYLSLKFDKEQFGNVDASDILFFFLMSLFGPISLGSWALFWLIENARELRCSSLDKLVVWVNNKL